MRFGFIPTEGGHLTREALAEVDRAETLGLDSVWMEEHHGVRGHYWPSPLVVLAGFATRTSRLLLGTDVVVLPFYDPVRAAEDAAMVDVLSEGRLVFGVAIGYRPDEFALYRDAAREAGGAVRGGPRRDPGALDAGRGHACRGRTIRWRTRESSRSPSSGRTLRSGSAAGAS